jgi:hypothetical protein
MSGCAAWSWLKVYSQSMPASLSAIPSRARNPFCLERPSGNYGSLAALGITEGAYARRYRNTLEHPSRSTLSLQINGQVTLSLALYAGIVEGCLPSTRSTVVLQPSVPGRGMSAIVDVVEQDFIVRVLGNGEPDGVSPAFGRQPAAGIGMTEVAEIAQRSIIGGEFSSVGAARPAEAGAQRQPIRERPCDRETSLGRKEKGAGHGSNLSSHTTDCVKFFCL